MDSIAFDYGPEEEEWKSVEGGTNMVTDAVIDMIKTKPTYNKRVTVGLLGALSTLFRKFVELLLPRHVL